MAKDARPFDHGELNIPGRTKNINRDLDRYKAEVKAAEQSAAKTASAQKKADRVVARELLAKHGKDMVASAVAKHPHLDAKKVAEMLKSDAHYDPTRTVRLIKRHVAETQRAANLAHNKTNPKIQRPDGGYGFVRPFPGQAPTQYAKPTRLYSGSDRLTRLADAHNLLAHGPDSRRVQIVKAHLERSVAAATDHSSFSNASWNKGKLDSLNRRIAAATPATLPPSQGTRTMAKTDPYGGPVDIGRSVKQIRAEKAAAKKASAPRKAKSPVTDLPVIQKEVKVKGTPIPKAPKAEKAPRKSGVAATKPIATAVGMDAGNKNMKAAGRTAWNHEDFNAASAARAKVAPSPAAQTASAAQKTQALQVSTVSYNVMKTAAAPVAVKPQVRLAPGVTPAMYNAKLDAVKAAVVDVARTFVDGVNKVYPKTPAPSAVTPTSSYPSGFKPATPVQGGHISDMDRRLAAGPKQRAHGRDAHGNLMEGFTSKSKSQLLREAGQKGVNVQGLKPEQVARKLGYRGLAGLGLGLAVSVAAMAISSRNSPASAGEAPHNDRTKPYTDKLGRRFNNGRLIVRGN